MRTTGAAAVFIGAIALAGCAQLMHLRVSAMRILAALLAAVALAACSTSTQPMATPVPSNLVIATFGDYGPIYTALPHVRPMPEQDDALVAVSFHEGRSFGIEGGRIFIKALAADGTVVLEVETIGLGDVIRLPAGDYVLETYYRSCDADCHLLSGPVSMGQVDARLRANTQYWLTVSITNERSRLVEVPGVPAN